MAPKGKPDPNVVTWLTLRCRGGGSLAPKVGPLGLSPKKLADDIAKLTNAYTGLNVTVKVRIQNRQTECSLVPSASMLIIAALKEPAKPKGSKEPIVHNGNLTFDIILDAARTMRERSLARTLAGTCKEILGTARSVGCTIDGKTPEQICDDIDNEVITVPDE